MKKLIILFLGLFFWTSCDKYREGITLPTMHFDIAVAPDTPYIRLGDTLHLRAAIPSTLSNGVKIEDGKALMKVFFGYCPETPVSESGFEASIKEEHFSVVSVSRGGIGYFAPTNQINHIYAQPYGDSLMLDIKIKPLKVGTYAFQIRSLFYEGSAGKTRTEPKFDVVNPNWWFNEYATMQPSDWAYMKTYIFAVTP